jgi:voltage-gated potassium channel
MPLFLTHAGEGALLVALTLFLQCAGMGLLIHWARLYFVRKVSRVGPVRAAILIVRFTAAIVVLHLLQILLWAGFFHWTCLPSWESAFYFSTTNYSTVGSGDLLLPGTWRTLGALESITGVLMCGLSASFLFALVLRFVEQERRFAPAAARPDEELAGKRRYS